MRRLRILMVASGHPDLSTGGAEIAAYGHFEVLKRFADCEPAFLASDEGGEGSPPGEAFHAHRGRPDEWIFHSAGFDRFKLSQPSAAVRDAFSQLLERLDPDVVHFHHYLNIGLELIGLARARPRQPRIVVTLHEFAALCHNHGVMVKRTPHLELCDSAAPLACAACFPHIGMRPFLERKAHVHAHLMMADVLVSPSHFLRNRYIEWGVPGRRIEVLDNGLPPIQPPPARRLGVSGRRDVFGYFGQIHPYKGLLQLLAAFAAIAERFGEAARLVIHGAYLELNDPRFIEAFWRTIEQCGSLVTFVGAYERAQLPALMGEVDWVVVPSIWWENAPLVIEEALACRRPVLCSDIGGMRERVRHGRDGYRFRVADSEAIVGAVLNASADEQGWSKLRRRLRRPITTEASVFNHLSIYREETLQER